jgi:hypothetical protein
MVQVLSVLLLPLEGCCVHTGSMNSDRFCLSDVLLLLLLLPAAAGSAQPPSLNVTPRGVWQRPVLLQLPSPSTAMKKPLDCAALPAAVAPGLLLPFSKRAAAAGAPPVEPLGDRRMLTTALLLAGELPLALLLPVCTAQQQRK